MQVANRRRGSKHAFLGGSVDDNRSGSIGSFTALSKYSRHGMKGEFQCEIKRHAQRQYGKPFLQDLFL